jgi:hypothetical protein
MRPDDINTRIHDESRALDAALQYFENGGLILPFSICRKSQLCCKRNFWPNANPEYQPTSRVSGSPNSWIIRNWLTVRPDGPLWFRGYDQWGAEEGAAQIVTMVCRVSQF